MSRITFQSPECKLFHKIISYDRKWFEQQKVAFSTFNIRGINYEAHYDSKSENIVYYIFHPEYIINEIPEQEILKAVKNKTSFLWELREKDFADFCWNNSIEVGKESGFCELLPLAIDFVEANRKNLTDFYLLKLESAFTEIFKKARTYINLDLYNEDDNFSSLLTFEDNLSSKNLDIFIGLTEKLKIKVITYYAQPIKVIGQTLSLTNELPMYGINLKKCEKICSFPLFDNIPLKSYYNDEGNNKTAAEFFSNLISNSPKVMRGSFEIMGKKRFLYDLLYTIEQTVNININRNLIEEKEWISFIVGATSQPFKAKASKKHVAILPAIKAILTSN